MAIREDQVGSSGAFGAVPVLLGTALISLIAMAVAVLILGNFTLDALTYLIDFQFRVAQRQDVMVTFVEPTVAGVKREIQKLPGVMQVDFFRSVPTRLRHRRKEDRRSS